MTQRNGFTLIELLVVIAIMTTVLTLVAPLMIEQVDKTKAAAEFHEARQYLTDSRKVAFLKGQLIVFTFEGKQLRRDIGSDSVTLEFQYLFFPSQQLQINANGFTDKTQITVVAGNKQQHIELAEKK
ncbi:type II secretion system GspH family protein [Rheinheimera muenzenbergensis]|uniref:Type II secretion system GspH family protein n=1 Tax=Rheinheimera muenzenbergensis TaxID=1193628 RepID=A0ABU8C2C7_9GAMM